MLHSFPVPPPFLPSSPSSSCVHSSKQATGHSTDSKQFTRWLLELRESAALFTFLPMLPRRSADASSRRSLPEHRQLDRNSFPSDEQQAARRRFGCCPAVRRRRSCSSRCLILGLLLLVALLAVVTTHMELRFSNIWSLRGLSSPGWLKGKDDFDRAEGKPRVAVCFYGLTRSLRWTLPSVRKRVLGALEEAGMHADIFVHTYDLMELNNVRAGETGVEYGSFVNDFQALKPTRSLVTNQDDFDLAWPNPVSLTHYHWLYPKEEVVGVIRNVLRAYWSMSMVWGLMVEHAVQKGFHYDAVVLARPDVWFHYDIDLPSRTFPLPEKTVFLPSFDADNPEAVRKNDRFAYGSVTAMRVLMNRIATLLDAGAGKYRGNIDSEWILGHHLQKHGISVQKTGLLLTRVRVTRDNAAYDERIVKMACQSGKDPMACEIEDAGFYFPAESAVE